MSSNFRGRGSQKNFNYRNEDNHHYPEYENHEENNELEDELDSSRSVMLLPNANLTISVFNDFRESRFRGNRGILKSNSYRDDRNFNDNNDRSNNYPRRGFRNFDGERGRARGFSHGNYPNDNDNSGHYSNQRGFRGRPLSASYDNYPDSRQERYHNKEASEDVNNEEVNRKFTEERCFDGPSMGGSDQRRDYRDNRPSNSKQNYDNGNNRQERNNQGGRYSDSHDDRVERDYQSNQPSELSNKETNNAKDGNNRDRQSSESYDQSDDYNHDRQFQRNNNRSRSFSNNYSNFGGRNISQNRRPFRSRGYSGRGRGGYRRYEDNKGYSGGDRHRGSGDDNARDDKQCHDTEYNQNEGLGNTGKCSEFSEVGDVSKEC